MANHALIIPALKPDERLVQLVKEVRAIAPNLQIVVVDDGSGPACGHLFDQLKFMYDCILCRHPENYGKGAAIKTGIGHMKQRCPGCAGYITADADGQHRPVDILNVAKALGRHPGHLILGTRDFSRKQVPFKSRWGNRITSGVFHLTTGTACPDTQTGLRGIPARYAELALDVPGERFEYEMSFLMAAARQSIPFMEVPIGTIYLDGNRSSHFRPVRDSARIYGIILGYLARPLFRRRKKQKAAPPDPPVTAAFSPHEEKAAFQEAAYANGNNDSSHVPAV